MAAGAAVVTELLLAARCCGQCLTSRDRIVSGERAAQIVRDCRRSGAHFRCHKFADDTIVHCRGVHDVMLRDGAGSTAYQFATRLGIPVVEIDPEVSHHE
jgi:hypothetical protein